MGNTYLARVDSDTVVLVLDGGTGDGDVGTLADVETVGVVTAVVVTVAVVDGHVLDGEVVRLDGDGLDGGVLDLQALDDRVVQGVGVEELGLGLAAVGALAVPPLGTVAVEDRSGRLGDGDVLAGDVQEGSIPLLVLPGSSALEGDLDWTWTCQYAIRWEAHWKVCNRKILGLRQELTVVPLFRSLRLRVSPAGTVMSLRTMSVQEVLLSEA